MTASRRRRWWRPATSCCGRPPRWAPPPEGDGVHAGDLPEAFRGGETPVEDRARRDAEPGGRRTDRFTLEVERTEERDLLGEAGPPTFGEHVWQARRSRALGRSSGRPRRSAAARSGGFERRAVGIGDDLGRGSQPERTHTDLVLGVAEEVDRDATWPPLERVRADEHPGGGGEVVEDRPHPPLARRPTPDGGGHEPRQDAAHHEMSGDLVGWLLARRPRRAPRRPRRPGARGRWRGARPRGRGRGSAGDGRPPRRPAGCGRSGCAGAAATRRPTLR